MKRTELTDQILSLLQPYPYLTSIPELAKTLKAAYVTIRYRVMELLGERKVGYIKKAGVKFFFTPYRADLDPNGSIDGDVNKYELK